MKRIYLLPLPLLLAATLTGCHQGMNAATTTQDETGNGIEMTTGELQIESVTIVAGKGESTTGSVSAVIVNAYGTPDELKSIKVDGREATLTPVPVTVPGTGSVAIASGGAASAVVELDAVAGQYAEVSFAFANSGTATSEVLVVPPIGYYESAAPAPAGKAPGATSPTSASPTPTPSAPAASH